MEVPAHLRIRMAKRNLSHAYLVVGENRRPLAEALAAAWVCTGETPPCGHCPGCRKAGLGIHPDIIRADPEGEGLKAEEVRALRSDAYIRPNEAPKKVYLLEHSELLNPTGQNILLKLIEEGPAYACFLFLSPQPGLLLPTIRSRCETLPAGRPGGGDLSRPDPHRGLSPGPPALPPLSGEEGPGGISPPPGGRPVPAGGGTAPAARPAAGAGPLGPHSGGL